MIHSFFSPLPVLHYFMDVEIYIYIYRSPTGPLVSVARLDSVGYGLILNINPEIKHHLPSCAHPCCSWLS